MKKNQNEEETKKNTRKTSHLSFAKLQAIVSLLFSSTDQANCFPSTEVVEVDGLFNSSI